jgi:Archaeal phage integrase
MGLAIRKHTCLAGTNSQSFETYLKAQNKRNIRQIISYAQRYHRILESGDVSPLINLQSGAMRRHVMESLTALSKYSGYYDKWQEIRKHHQLRWTSGDESIKSLERFFNPDLTLDNICDLIRQVTAKAPTNIANIIRYACLTGLRPTEIIESLKLINQPESMCTYYHPERQTLEHFRYPEIFIRHTKKAYISFVTPEILQLVRFETNNTKMITYNIIRKRLDRLGLSMRLGLCRKLFASHLRQSGLQPEVVDLLQGRVSTSILTRHYLVPYSSLRRDVLSAVEKLREKIMID